MAACGILIAVLIAIAVSAENPERSAGQKEMERTLGGLTVGVSTIDDARRIYVKFLRTDRGLYVVRFDGVCEFGFALEDAQAIRHRVS